METGATDGVYRAARHTHLWRQRCFCDEDDIRAHGRDERILVKSFYDAVDFMYDVAIALGK